MSIAKKNSIWLVYFVLSIPILATVVESLTFAGFIQKNFFVPWPMVVLASLAATSIGALGNRFTPVKAMSAFLLGLYVCLSCRVILLFWLEAIHFPNYIFSTLHLHLSVIRWLPLILGSILLLLNIKKITKGKIVLFLFGCLFATALVSVAFPQLFLEIGVENGLLETLQVITLLSSLILLILVLLKIQFSKGFFYFLCLLLFSCAVFFLAGEEISWGQQLFHFQSLDFFVTNNVQKEDTLHNLRSFQTVLFNTYILIGAAGSLGWLIEKVWEEKFPRHQPNILEFLPKPWMAPYFLPMLIYGLLRAYRGPVQVKTWEETAELFAYLGILFVAGRIFMARSEKFRR